MGGFYTLVEMVIYNKVMRERDITPSSRAKDTVLIVDDLTDRRSPCHPESLALAQVALAEGDIEEAVVLAEESAGMDQLETG